MKPNFWRAWTTGLVALTLVLASSSPRAISSNVVISEFRARGPNGGSDEFIELFNTSGVAVDIGGWKIRGSNSGGTVGTRVTIPAGTVVGPGCFYLITNSSTSGGPYSGAVLGNLTYATGITDDGGIAVTLPDDTPVDQVGMSAGSTFKEGTPLASLGSTNLNRGYERKPGGAGGHADTDQNSADFAVITPSNPQNQSSACIEQSTPPTGVGAAAPGAVFSGDTVLLTVTVTPGASPASTGIGVSANLAQIGGGATQQLFDDGTSGDNAPGDNIFSFSTTASGPVGANSVSFSVNDAEGRTTTGSFTLTIIPPAIPIHAIQGSGSRSDYQGQFVTTTGIVTALRFSSYYIQTPEAGYDADPQTSEGLLVFAPPGGLARGDMVRVSGTVVEFVPNADPTSPSITELGSGSLATVLSNGNPLPVPAQLLAGDTVPAGGFEQLERFEGMRVTADITAISGTDGTTTESTATSASNGDFFAVIRGVARPFREPGVEVSRQLPPGAPPTVPRFDQNPERLRVDSNAQQGAAPIEIVAGQSISGLTGVLDYGFRSYTIAPDPQPVVIMGASTAVPVAVPADGEFTIAAFNVERFFDDINDPAIGDPVLTSAAFERRLNKASLIVRHVLVMPDILAVEEVENLSTLQRLAARINADATASGTPNPEYQAYLEEGNDIGGIDSGFLVKSTRVQVIDVLQVGADTLFEDGSRLNDRPPLVLMAQVHGPVGTPYPVTVIVNHLRSLNGIDEEPDGDRVRRKRRAQAEFLANYVQVRQAANATERIVSVGDYNAFDVNDGYVDVLGTIIGTPTPAAEVTLSSPDLVNPDLFNVASTNDGSGRYSFVFEGNAQALDHILVNQAIRDRPARMVYARTNADFPESFRSDGARPERLSDHDIPVGYFTLPGTPALDLLGSATMTVECRTTFTDPGAVATDPHLGVIPYELSGQVDTTRCGTYVLTYVAHNGFASASRTRTVIVADTIAPSVVLSGSAAVTIEAGAIWNDPGASASDGCAGDLTAAIQIGGTVNTLVPGVYTLTYSASDGFNTTTMTRVVTVEDTTAPAIGQVTVSPSLIENVHHKMVDVTVSYSASDVTGAPTCSVVVGSNEPVNAPGDGNTSVDWQVLGAHAVRIRAERSGMGTGRIYTITVTCVDAAGNAATQSATVTVPR